MKASMEKSKEPKPKLEASKSGSKTFHEVVKAIEEFRRKIEEIETQKQGKSSSNAIVF